MSIFGWSYPPGCNSVPGDEERNCLVCRLTEDLCLCEECPVCGCVGDPDCYDTEGHGMAETVSIKHLDRIDAERAIALAEESAYWQQYAAIGDYYGENYE